MRHMQTKCLYLRVTILQIVGVRLVNILCKKLFLFFQGFNIVYDFQHFLAGYIGSICVLVQNFCNQCFFFLTKIMDDVISNIIHYMY